MSGSNSAINVPSLGALPGGPATGDIIAVSRSAVPYKYDPSNFLPAIGGSLTGELILFGNPTDALGAAPKQYVDSAVSSLLSSTGGTMTGALTLAGNPTSALQAAPKQYVDTSVATVATYYGQQIGGVDMGALKGLSIDPRFATTSRITVAGSVWCTKATVKPSQTITQVIYNVTVAANTPTNCYIAIFSTTGALLSVTADLTSSTPFSAGAHTVTIPSFTTGTTVASVIVAFLVGAATTLPTFTSGASITVGQTWGQDGTAGYPMFSYGAAGTYTAMPSSLTLNSTNCLIAAPGLAAMLVGLN